MPIKTNSILEFDCEDCGLCCRHYGGGLDLYPEDLDRWQGEKNPETRRRITDFVEITGSRKGTWVNRSDDLPEIDCPMPRIREFTEDHGRS